MVSLLSHLLLLPAHLYPSLRSFPFSESLSSNFLLLRLLHLHNSAAFALNLLHPKASSTHHFHYFFHTLHHHEFKTFIHHAPTSRASERPQHGDREAPHCPWLGVVLEVQRQVRMTRPLNTSSYILLSGTLSRTSIYISLVFSLTVITQTVLSTQFSTLTPSSPSFRRSRMAKETTTLCTEWARPSLRSGATGR